jgi:hypothetical protein
MNNRKKDKTEVASHWRTYRNKDGTPRLRVPVKPHKRPLKQAPSGQVK